MASNRWYAIALVVLLLGIHVYYMTIRFEPAIPIITESVAEDRMAKKMMHPIRMLTTINFQFFSLIQES